MVITIGFVGLLGERITSPIGMDMQVATKIPIQLILRKPSV
jgi:hypothetical protein